MFYVPDFFPIVPGQSMGFLHPHGEIHIVAPGNAVACSGQLNSVSRLYVESSPQIFILIGNDDAVDSQCQIKTVPNVLAGNILNHVSRVVIGQKFCIRCSNKVSWDRTRESGSVQHSARRHSGLMTITFGHPKGFYFRSIGVLLHSAGSVPRACLCGST